MLLAFPPVLTYLISAFRPWLQAWGGNWHHLWQLGWVLTVTTLVATATYFLSSHLHRSADLSTAAAIAKVTSAANAERVAAARACELETALIIQREADAAQQLTAQRLAAHQLAARQLDAETRLHDDDVAQRLAAQGITKQQQAAQRLKELEDQQRADAEQNAQQIQQLARQQAAFSEQHHELEREQRRKQQRKRHGERLLARSHARLTSLRSAFHQLMALRIEAQRLAANQHSSHAIQYSGNQQRLRSAFQIWQPQLDSSARCRHSRDQQCRRDQQVAFQTWRYSQRQRLRNCNQHQWRHPRAHLQEGFRCWLRLVTAVGTITSPRQGTSTATLMRLDARLFNEQIASLDPDSFDDLAHSFLSELSTFQLSVAPQMKAPRPRLHKPARANNLTPPRSNIRRSLRGCILRGSHDNSPLTRNSSIPSSPGSTDSSRDSSPEAPCARKLQDDQDSSDGPSGGSHVSRNLGGKPPDRSSDNAPDAPDALTGRAGGPTSQHGSSSPACGSEHGGGHRLGLPKASQ